MPRLKKRPRRRGRLRKGIYAHVAAQKGGNEHLCGRAVEDLDDMGYKEVMFKSDQEPALCSFIEIVKASWNGDAALENSPGAQAIWRSSHLAMHACFLPAFFLPLMSFCSLSRASWVSWLGAASSTS